MNVIVTKENESIIYKGKIYKHGASFEVEDKVGESLVERGLCASEDIAEMQSGTLDEEQLSEMPYNELKKLAAQMGIDASGRKEELIARICGTEIYFDGGEPEDAPAPEDADSSGELPATDMPD